MDRSENKYLSTLSPAVLEDSRDSVGKLLLREYGAIFTAGNGAVPPDRLIFRDEAEVAAFQNRVEIGIVRFDDIIFELQAQAADALKNAADLALKLGLSITPRSTDSGRRYYDDTVDLWKSRVEPALEHWVFQGRIAPDEAAIIRAASSFEQVPLVLSLEQTGIYFAKDLSKSIIYSVAPPGASQHLSMLAFDVKEFNEPAVRKTLAEHCWYQTVVSDLPHFTYLGFAEKDLPGLGLKVVENLGRPFWVPDF